jgi:hypothetical protein
MGATGFDSDDITAVARQALVRRSRGGGRDLCGRAASGQDYSLKGADLTLQAGRGTYLKVEHSRSEATSAPVFFSDNGGLSFSRSIRKAREGEATAVEARVNLRELGWTQRDRSVGAWCAAGWRLSGRFDSGQRVREQGAELLGYVTDDFSVYARYSEARRVAVNR